MQRRDFLHHSLCAVPLLSSLVGGPARAAAPGTPRTLLVFLRGAYDAASLLVPTSSSFYYEQRPNIAIPRPGSAAGAAVALTPDWGLHPAVAASLMPLWEARELAFVPFAGTDDLSRSHFETQDSIEMGQPLTGARDFQSGFLNRLSQVLGGNAAAMSFTDSVPTVFRGAQPVPNLALGKLSRSGVGAQQAQGIADMYRGTPLASVVQEGLSSRKDALRELEGPTVARSPASASMAGSPAMAESNGTQPDTGSRGAITAKGFEGEARRVARLMRERYQLGFIDVGGWDTHVGQGQATGYLPDRLAELAKGLAAYREEMGPSWADATVVVMSEFGRTFKENGSRGTDHGHGSVYWVLGGKVRGGQVAGEQLALVPGSLFQNRDYPVLNEYRAVLGGLFQRLYGLNPRQLAQVFPGVAPRDLGLV